MFCYAISRRALFERSEFASLWHSNYNLLVNGVQGKHFLSSISFRQKKLTAGVQGRHKPRILIPGEFIRGDISYYVFLMTFFV